MRDRSCLRWSVVRGPCWSRQTKALGIRGELVHLFFFSEGARDGEKKKEREKEKRRTKYALLT